MPANNIDQASRHNHLLRK